MSAKMLAVPLLACLAGSLAIRTLEKIGHGGVLLMPAVGYGIGYCISRTGIGSRVGAVLLSLTVMYSAALLTNVPSSYQMFRSEWGAPRWLALLISLPASAVYPIFASAQSGFYALMLLLSFAAAWRGTVP